MAGRNWLGTFGGTKSFNVNSELDRGYEAALLIQSLELEYYGDRPIRPDLELSVASTVQATILRKLHKIAFPKPNPRNLHQIHAPKPQHNPS